MKHIALVTGASSGVGKEFVTQFATGAGGQLDEIWGIARREDELLRLAKGSSHITIRPVPLDLTHDESFDKLERMLTDEDCCVQWLVNCAGFGKFGSFSSMDRTTMSQMIRLNCIGVVQMSAVALPFMSQGSRIINLASIAGAVPQPYLAVYSATKAFVLELTRMIDDELQGTGIHATAVCPKFMQTGFLNAPGNVAVAQAMCKIGYQDVSVVVRHAFAASLLGRTVCIPSLDMRGAALAAKLLPRRALFWLEGWLFGTRALG